MACKIILKTKKIPLIQKIYYPLPPSLNETINLARTGKYVSSGIKKKWNKLIADNSKHIKPYSPERKVWFHFTWILKSKMRDFDNVSSGIKYILDGLVIAGIIKDDSQKYIGNRLIHEFIIDREKGDRCLVTMSDDFNDIQELIGMFDPDNVD